MPVPITDSVGYEGTVDEPQWAELVAAAGGNAYGVLGASDWKVTAGVGDRVARIAPGAGFGHGVLDRTTEDALLPSLTAPASGSVWHLIVAHRDWQGNVSSFDSIEGSATAQIPTRDETPGTVDDQPLALVRVQAGQSQIVEYRDLRLWGGDGGAYAVDELALQYANRVGTRIRIGDIAWERTIDAFGSAQWVSHDVGDTGWVNDLSINVNSAWSLSSTRFRRSQGRVRGRAVVQRVTGAPSMNSAGSFTTGNILRLPVGWRSNVTETPTMRGVESAVPYFPSMDQEGLVTLGQGVPNNPLSSGGRYIIDFDHPVD